MNTRFKRALSSVLAFVMVMSCMMVMNVNSAFAATIGTTNTTVLTGDSTKAPTGENCTVTKGDGSVTYSYNFDSRIKNNTIFTGLSFNNIDTTKAKFTAPNSSYVAFETDGEFDISIEKTDTKSIDKIFLAKDAEGTHNEPDLSYNAEAQPPISSATKVSAGKYYLMASETNNNLLNLKITVYASGSVPTPGESTTETTTETTTEAEPDVEISTEKVEIATVETETETATKADTNLPDETPIEITTDAAGNYSITDANSTNTAKLKFSFAKQSTGIVRISGEATQPDGHNSSWTFAHLGNGSKEVFGIRVLGGSETVGNGPDTVGAGKKGHLGLRIGGKVLEGCYDGDVNINANGTKIKYEFIINYYDSTVTLIANGVTVADAVSFEGDHSIDNITFVTASGARNLLVSTPTVSVETKPEKVADGVIKYGEQYYVVKGVSEQEVTDNSSYVIKATGDQVAATESDNKVYTGVNIAGYDFSASDVFTVAPDYVVGVIIGGTVADANGLADKYELEFTPNEG